jgi:hypothetical protein
VARPGPCTWHAGQDGDFFEEEASSKTLRLYHNAQPLLARVGTASRLILSDGIGFVKVSGAQVSVKEKFFLLADQRLLTRPSLLIEDLQGLRALFYLGKYRTVAQCQRVYKYNQGT